MDNPCSGPEDNMIKGVVLKKVTKRSDQRGFFAELVKFGEDSFHQVMQISYAETNPGVIKAFHIHDYWETWCVIKGYAKVVLHDLRKDSPTKGQTDVILTGEDKMMVIAIPGGVAHGYLVLDKNPMGIIYTASEAYDPKEPAIKKIPFNDSNINFDWSKP